ncbi:valyl-tRNA synthetase [Chitinophaga terrae (ex Kim and Jung 2007)]|uniref:valine--tRNA ligase n=1 Tax=Chitinophaga terrae (ex Kim and Jung 2007) TaxID=408074 RepID=UPI002788233E|nr:valine--tRNA ligase [Chitinophaga terrae (ex Kim and Jung 2007)]MDQ0106985.1 valyl-tRNA synthetase [Chitinophaga terrae (ex Kim and Jung 2007)]
MELSKNYLPATVEEKWYQHWMDKGYFRSKPDGRQPFTVVIPPPNVTGVLHLGHTLNETVQDILVRRARMSGYNACWVPGSDHASIATEAKVVDMLKREKGIEKSQLSREEFLKYAFEWKDKYGGIIYHQIKKLGCSCDWDRVTFTMDDHYYKAVIRVFIDLYKKGVIYRGARMINWDPKAKTALSDEEVEYKDIQGKLYHVKYPVTDAAGTPTGEFITIATQRPETIMGDTAICVHPEDERYTHLKGFYVTVPLVNRRIPVIFDTYVDKEFGTGALKVTPAHDINDYNLGLKHNLEIVDTLNDDGTLSEAAVVFVGEDRFAARKKVVVALEEAGQLVKEQEYTTRLGYSQRNPDTVVEPRISTQWFVKMAEMAKPALDAVVNGDVRIHPGDRFLATYKYWMENVKDWCISRQLWWGQRIPAWYTSDGSFEVAATAEEAVQQFAARGIQVSAADLTQDEDCLDTWFSSWLWPMEVFNGISNPGNEDINYYYPTSVLVTGQDIIFFWVARMIMAGLEYKQTKPFSDVYFTGMVRDKQGRKMSKQLGNSPDLLELIHEFGADAVRFGIMISSPAGNDLLYDNASCEQGRNFNNKMWNALKLIKMWEQRQEVDNTDANGHFAVKWFESRLNQVQQEVAALHQDFRLSEGLKALYSLIWDDFCSWYLEWIKPGFEQPISAAVYRKTIYFFEQLMQLLHPYMPFITEEIYQLLDNRAADDSLMMKQFTTPAQPVHSVLVEGALAKEVITSIRDARNKNQIKPKDQVVLHIETKHQHAFAQIENILAKQVNAKTINFVQEPVPGCINLVIQKDKFYIETETALDTSAQKATLLKDLDYLKGFLVSVEKKLSNERFVQNAKPEAVEAERRKKSDAEAKIAAIEESLKSL